jgi:lipopolysaccharide transport system ATP-binding protein
MKPIIEVCHLWKQYQIGGERTSYLSLRERLTQPFRSTPKEHFWALKDINFEVYEGECVGIVGRNGAGKSTLLKILSQITPPTKGHILARGRIASLLEVGTGFHPELTGRENVYLNGSILGLRKTEIDQKFDEIVAFSGVERFLDTPLKHYSSGMKLRLAFSVAAHLEPEILLIDEVLAVGDAEFQKKCLGKMDEVSKSGRTVLFVSHNLGAVRQLCGRGVLLEGGEVKLDADIEGIIHKYLMNSSDITNILLNKNLGSFSIIKMECAAKNDKGNIEVSFFLELDFNKPSSITDLTLLLYNEHQVRIGIIDFRSEIRMIGDCSGIRLSGKMLNLALVEGRYSLGLYINNSYVHGDYLDLVMFDVQHENDFEKYPKMFRGIIELKKDLHEIQILRTTR